MAKLLGVEKNGHRVDRYFAHYGDGGKALLTVETVEDVEPILEANKRAYADAPSRFGNGSTHVASIPTTVIEAVCKHTKIPFAEFIKGKTDRAQKAWNVLLNSPEFRHFRTRPGRVDVKQR